MLVFSGFHCKSISFGTQKLVPGCDKCLHLPENYVELVKPNLWIPLVYLKYKIFMILNNNS